MNPGPEETKPVPTAPTPPDEPTAREVADLLAMLIKAVRARTLYQENNPVYQRFITALVQGLRQFWDRSDSLFLTVEEGGFRWSGTLIPGGQGRDTLPFLFYKDGIRSLTFLPGFEEEVLGFLDVIRRAREVDPEGDDLVTLLWEREFGCLQYGAVDLLAESVPLEEPEERQLPPIDVSMLRADAGAAGAAGEVQTGEAAPEAYPAAQQQGVSREDFEDTLYFLDDSELQALRDELDRELSRDLKADVLHALFDRLEDGAPARQTEILGVLRQMLPIFLSRGELAISAVVVRELEQLLAREDTLAPDQRAAADALLDQLSEPVVLEQLIQSLEHGGINPAAADLSLFLSRLRPAALPVLVEATESVMLPWLRALLATAMERLAAEHGDALVALLDAPSARGAAGAAKLAGRLRIAAAAEPLRRLLAHGDAAVRLAAVDALYALRTGASIEALQDALDDADREVRMAAARGLGALRFAPARSRFAALMQGRTLREADLTERIAFFEAYGAVGGAEAVDLLDRLLNGRGGLLSRRQPPELRACAALALGKVETPAARSALEKAAADPDNVVRSAVQRALRQEVAP
jgi:HEAT repeat protein